MKKIFTVLTLVLMFRITFAQSRELAPNVYKRFVTVSDNGLKINGIFSLPKGGANQRYPAVIILHGSSGPDSRGAMHAKDLLEHGIATLEIDMWTPRQLAGGALNRPKAVRDTLPDLSKSLSFLALQPEIDKTRIGGLGFSWGGVMLMLASDVQYGEQIIRSSGLSLKGAAIFYPVCWGYNKIEGYPFKKLENTKLLILTGEKDGYDDDPRACKKLVDTLSTEDQMKVKILSYAGAYHGFNMLENKITYVDPFAHRGKGGETMSVPNKEAREKSRKAVVNFFSQLFGM